MTHDDNTRSLALVRAGDVPACTTLGLLVMDESGSMERFGAAPLEAVEGYVRGLQTGPEASRIAAAIVTFSSHGRVRVPATPARHFPSGFPYLPDGGTRLYGTVRDALAAALEQRPASITEVVMAVFTDGEDNRSSERTRQELVELAASAQQAGFVLLTFGIGIDGVAIARNMGFPIEHARSVPATRRAVVESMRYSSDVTSMRATSASRAREKG